MRAAKKGSFQNIDLVAPLYNVDYLVKVRGIDFHTDSLGLQAKSQRDQIHVYRAISVPEKTPFNTLSSCKLAKLGSGHFSASVVVAM